jgi:hypothetical protein
MCSLNLICHRRRSSHLIIVTSSWSLVKFSFWRHTQKNLENILIFTRMSQILKQRSGVLENRMSRRVCGPRSEGVTGGWREISLQELHSLDILPSIIRVIISRMR